MNKTQKLYELLRKARAHIDIGGPGIMNAVYITPAQSLRNAADKIEAKERLIAEIDKELGLGYPQ